MNLALIEIIRRLGTATASQTPVENQIPVLDAAKILNLSAGLKVGNTGVNTLLDWVDRGTWTPLLSGTTTAGTTGYDTHTGRYLRICNLVACSIALNINAKSGTGTVKLTGLPFVPADSFSGGMAFAGITGLGAAGTFPAKSLSLYGTTANTMNIAISDLNAGSTFVFLDMANISTDFQLYGTFFYFTS